MRKARVGFTGLSLFLSVAGLGAQSRESALRTEVHIYNYSAFSAEMVARAEQETIRIFGANWRRHNMGGLSAQFAGGSPE
jgi:hypothetical protein